MRHGVCAINLVEFINGDAMKPGYDYGNEFEYGLDVILDGLEMAMDSNAQTTSHPEARPT